MNVVFLIMALPTVAGAAEPDLLLVGSYYVLLVVAALAGILLAPVLRRWWDARHRRPA